MIVNMGRNQSYHNIQSSMTPSFLNEIEITKENDNMDQLLPTLLLTAAKEEFKFNRQLRITHVITESKFKKKVSALNSPYKKKHETTRRNKAADG